ncbi:MAG: bifunctional 2-keto-4-hydroxyglutarate aldolase/2-keto-3-deoxy-6-phosphogluconate aldolase [Peptoniphilaceae bacterium]|nr:bifunctional 2-keto-4-hydroxyglutarate aldolase/2-keto-3-deoxy-6-phosphogluconate aldolase [Peptoniphilaceae bacterium]MDY6019168.1 bifunctional 2-keto-4-hydroxyglutarate aldolase/2-keto-3-deoxy-6-phosphogluconate aldolase [Anaerococcus sp.]
MSKLETLNRIHELGIVPVVRGKDEKQAIEYCKGLVEGGINILEVTFTIPNAIEVFKKLQEELPEDTLIGAGTVTDPITARLAILNGAKFIVSPAFDKNVAKLCNKYQIPYMPGCITPTEILEALSYGVDIIKLFPGSLTGPSYVKAIHGPIPYVNIMPTGGVSLENVEEWFKVGVYAVGAGSNLVKGTKEEISQKSKQYLEKIRKARQ